MNWFKTNFIIYVDADNQSHRRFRDLIQLVKRDLNGKISKVVFSANELVTDFSKWTDPLDQEGCSPSIEIIQTDVSADAADIGMILHLGQLVDKLKRRRIKVLIFSNDQLLTSAARRLNRMGAIAYAAWSQSTESINVVFDVRETSSIDNSEPKPVARVTHPNPEAIKHRMLRKVDPKTGLINGSVAGQILKNAGYTTSRSRRQAIKSFKWLQQIKHDPMYMRVVESITPP